MNAAQKRDFAIRLRLARLGVEMGPTAFGKQINYSKDQVLYWERTGRIDASALRAVSEVSGRSLDWFYLPIYEEATTSPR